MRVKCFYSTAETGVVKLAASGLGLHIRKKLVNQHLIDLAQLGEKI